MRAAPKSRWRFLRQAFPSGAGPLIAVIGAVTILVPGSLLGIFLDNFWLGAFVVAVFVIFALVVGAYRLAEPPSLATAPQSPRPVSLADSLRALHAEGLSKREKIANDSAWGIAHHHSGFGPWSGRVMAVLQEETPDLSVWFHQMESPALPLLTQFPDDAKRNHLALFDWSLDRLADIEAMVRAKSAGGHPGGEDRTQHFLRLGKALQLLQEVRLLSGQLVNLGAMPGGGRLEPEVVNVRIEDCTLRTRALLEEIVGSEESERLIAEASVDTATIRPGIDPEGALLMQKSQLALRAAIVRPGGGGNK